MQKSSNVRLFIIVSALFYGFLSVAHLARLLTGLHMQIGGIDLPVWISWGGMIAAGVMAVWGYSMARGR